MMKNIKNRFLKLTLSGIVMFVLANMLSVFPTIFDNAYFIFFPFLVLGLDYLILFLEYAVLGVSGIISIITVWLIDMQDDAIERDKQKTYISYVLRGIFTILLIKLIVTYFNEKDLFIYF